MSTRCDLHGIVPIRLKFATRHFGELTVPRAVHGYEEAATWKTQTPQFRA
jgi:hypothetical protein